MFENTLLILKADYMQKRKPVLLKLLSEGFMIQTSRKLLFSPELAAEFYADYADCSGFMLEVILLSKGTVEAFILTKENAVQELLNIMICYFTSTSEMERNVHVTKNANNVAREINFIFPNYIHEPTQFFDTINFCKRPMLKPLISEIYEIMQKLDTSTDSWKVHVADYLTRSNSAVPEISNQCSVKPDLGLQERGQQTVVTYAKPALDDYPGQPYKSVSSASSPCVTSSPHSSMILSSSTCVTCPGFERTEPGIIDVDFNKRLEPQDEKVCEGEETIWKEVIVYEEVLPEEEAEPKELLGYIGEEGEGEEEDALAIQSEIEIHSDEAPPPETPPPPAATAALETAEEMVDAPPLPSDKSEHAPEAAPPEERAEPPVTESSTKVQAPEPAAIEEPPAPPSEPEAAPLAPEEPAPAAEEAPPPPAEEAPPAPEEAPTAEA